MERTTIFIILLAISMLETWAAPIASDYEQEVQTNKSDRIIKGLSGFGYIQIFYIIILIVGFLSCTCYGLIMYDSWIQRNKLKKRTNASSQPNNNISDKTNPNYYVRQLSYDFIWKSTEKFEANDS